MASGAHTAKDVALFDLVENTDKLITRLEKIDKALADNIEQATADAAGKAFLSARLNFESMIKNNERKLIDAGRYAAAQIGNDMNTRIAVLVAANETLARHAWRLIAGLGGFALIAGTIGGVIGAKLAGM